jgi:hypothetical protein
LVVQVLLSVILRNSPHSRPGNTTLPAVTIMNVVVAEDACVCAGGHAGDVGA